MIAIAAGTRAYVDILHAGALEHGGMCEGPPGVRGAEDTGFYAAYFRDPDGNSFAPLL